MQKVSVLEQKSYELESLKENILKSLKNIIDVDKIFSSNKVVMIKVNAVSNLSYEHAYTTHPMFLKALIQVLKKFPVKIMVGDNPPFKDMKHTLKGNGILDVVEEENVDLVDNTELTEIKVPEPIKYESFKVSKNFVDADILINLPKLKTHSFTYFSCAEKNYFGMIFGLQKSKWHVNANNPLDFGSMINDLYTATKAQFEEDHCINLCDAIECLEGDGPTTGGKKTTMNCIIASTSAVAADIVGLKCAGLKLSKSFITTIGIEHHVEVFHEDEIQVISEYEEDNNLLEPEKPIVGIKLLQKQFMKNIMLEHPVVNHDICLRCGACTQICPAKTMRITKKGGYPHLTVSKCIRCWCCSEVCPVSAISKSKRPLIGRIIIKD